MSYQPPTRLAGGRIELPPELNRIPPDITRVLVHDPVLEKWDVVAYCRVGVGHRDGVEGRRQGFSGGDLSTQDFPPSALLDSTWWIQVRADSKARMPDG